MNYIATFRSDNQLSNLLEKINAATTYEEMDALGTAYNKRLKEIEKEQGWEPIAYSIEEGFHRYEA